MSLLQINTDSIVVSLLNELVIKAPLDLTEHL